MNDSNLIDELHLDLLPYSISAPLYMTITETNKIRQLHLFIHSYGQLVHFLALCHISDYIRYPDIRDATGEDILAGLKRPSLGHLVRIIREIPQLLLKNHITPFIKEWVTESNLLDKHQYKDCMDSNKQSQKAIEVLSKLRNEIAHGGLPPDEKLSEEIYQRCFPVLRNILNELKFLKNVVVYRVIRSDNETLDAILLRGYRETFHHITVAHNQLFSRDYPIPDCFLRITSRESLCLGLVPMLIGSLTNQNDYGFSEPLLLYKGLGNKVVYYLGVKTSIDTPFETPKYYDDVIDKLFTSFPSKPCCWESPFVTSVSRQTLISILANRGVKYFPEVFQNREKYSTLLNDFVHDDKSNVIGLLLVADSGVGKTSLLCHTAVSMLNAEERTALPVLIICKNIAGNVNSFQEEYESGKLGVLGNYLRELLGFINISSNWNSLLTEIEKRIKSKGDEKGEPKLVLLVDAINEAFNPFHLLQELDYVVNFASRNFKQFSWLRCVATLRKGAYEIWLSKFTDKGIRFPQRERAYIREPDESGKPSFGIILSSFSEYEAKCTYERYQKQAKEDTCVPACLTLYQDLPTELQQAIRHPLMLRLLMQTYNQKSVPANLLPIDLFQQFHDSCLTTANQNTAVYIAKCCLELGQPRLPLTKLQGLIAEWKTTKQEYELLICLNPIEQLLDLNILIVNPQQEYYFAHQLFFEFLLFRHLLGLDLPHLELLKKVFEVVQHPEMHMEEEVGALRMLLLFRIKQGEYQLINNLADLLYSKFFLGFFMPLAFELYKIDKKAYQLIQQYILQSESKLILVSGVEIYRVIGDRKAQLAVTKKQLELEQDFVQKTFLQLKDAHLSILSNRIHDAEDLLEMLENSPQLSAHPMLILAVYTEAGYLNFVTGNSKKALSAYSKSMNILDELHYLLSEEEYLFKRREILAGRGCVEHNIDDNEACVISHSEAMRIDQKLGNKVAIALVLVNLADAHWGCYHYDQSLRIYQDAIDAAAKSCYQDAMDVALIGRGAVLWSIGRFVDAEASVNAGLEVAKQLNYSWDLAYGLLYKSNIQASQKGVKSALETNQEAKKLAETINAEYLVALASSYLFWKQEIIKPGLLETRQDIENCMEKCKFLEFRGVSIMLMSLRVLNMIADHQISKEEVEIELKQLINILSSKAPIKGAWELIGLHIIGAVKNRKNQRASIDTVDLEDIIDEIREQKISSMNVTDREIYLATRKVWKYN